MGRLNFISSGTSENISTFTPFGLHLLSDHQHFTLENKQSFMHMWATEIDSFHAKDLTLAYNYFSTTTKRFSKVTTCILN